MPEPIQEFLQFLSQAIPADLQRQGQVLGLMILVLWGLELLDELFLNHALNRLGIRPRTLRGLQGVLWAPLLHGDFQHLAANTMPLLILGWFVLLSGLEPFVIVTLTIWLFSGLGVWLVGRPRSNHIGASSIVFGYLGFLLLRGYLDRSPMAVSLAAMAGLLYGGMIWGVLPLQRGSSWEGHLCGFLGGALAAYYFAELSQLPRFNL
ncbi:rhomboid family intramembrane serine protease [Lyngbya confervoides]|uniref:Rhomboid family intramembrane serine protease n=1 Tax=Lyngbya confervoides BDU141951 TaxID=1574623 RepID=A0ABD4T268_9CYAN|nr:rhomboid family intramembrane serine protease [Lyngbya confervoides]MCM1982832.1 rhomboid family intramembrane serine protease [Lyngbya confervoides BDU141951]